MGIFNLTESERNEILSLHNNARILKEQATPAATTGTATPAESTPQDRKSKIMKLQTILKTKYNADLGATGPNKDGIDGDLGAKTLTALSSVMKSKTPAAGTTAAPAAGTTPAPAAGTTPAPAAGTTPAPAAGTTPAPAAGTTPAPAAGTTPAPAAENPADVMGTGVASPQLNQASQQALGGQLTPQQIRQQSRFDQKLARQARRTARRAQ
jgi:hypothetical protein